MSDLSRREFIRRAGMTATGLLAFHAFAQRYGSLGVPFNPTQTASDRFLIPAQTRNTGETFLALPKDFQYTVFGKTGTRMSDGNLTPSDHDGMAAFRVKNELRLVRNHEVNKKTGSRNAAIGPNAFDPLASGGTTTLVIDPRTREITRDFVSLSGTLFNCAGGATPWNSWISCEEIVLGRRRYKNSAGEDRGGFERRHGYCFEVSAAADQAVAPVPLKQMGRLVHEAVAIDPGTGIVYLTEDVATAGFYRFIPHQKAQLAAGGRLQMLAVKGAANFDTRTQQKQGAVFPVSWVDIPNADPPEADLDELAVYKQGIAGGAATFTRLEGCFFGRGRVYFTSTDGDDKKLGQVWEYVPSGRDDGHLTLLLEPTESTLLNMPDNICLAGEDLLICEDNGVTNYIRVLTPKGQVFNLAKNIAPGFVKQEFAGLTFSPDGKTLFVNLQVPGMTFAIWGPWQRFRV